MAADAVVLELDAPDAPDGVRQQRLSSPGRLVWPEAGVTKRDLADYWVAVAPAALRALARRPVTLERFRDGVGGEAFFSKNPPKGMPEWIETVELTYPSGRRHPQVVVSEIATLVWAAQMSTITVHPWPVRVPDVDRPDELRIDLDPQPGRTFADAATAAVLLRELMGELGLTAFVKTSGNRGVHVFARIRPEHEFLEVRHAVIGIGRELERRDPDLVTMAWWKEERGRRIFVDFNQSNRDRTIAAAWSPRPLPHAPVSTPLSWDELAGTDPALLTVRSVPERLADGDPWAAMDDAVGSIDAALDLWRADVEERGLGELSFPPDYPKMPGEPPRVQPSRKVAAHWTDGD
ncbi:non-homologous end-joining DNA ligase [Angustibacter aerolatus]